MGLAERISILKTVNLPAGRSSNADYKPSFRESTYERPLVNRLTPLAQFIIGLAAVAVLACLILLVSRALEMRNGTELLSDRFNARPVVQVTLYAPRKQVANVVPAQQPAPKAEPTPMPTLDPTRATWADKLKQQPDGTLLAPQAVVAKAVADLGSYYGIQINMPLDGYLAQREAMLTTYFAGAALSEMRSVEEMRDLYAMNRAGKYTVEVRHFSPDGLSAKAAVIKRDWVSDVYDIASKQLVAAGRTYKNTLTVMTVLYDQADGRWKFAAVDEVVELQP